MASGRVECTQSASRARTYKPPARDACRTTIGFRRSHSRVRRSLLAHRRRAFPARFRGAPSLLTRDASYSARTFPTDGACAACETRVAAAPRPLPPPIARAAYRSRIHHRACCAARTAHREGATRFPRLSLRLLGARCGGCPCFQRAMHAHRVAFTCEGGNMHASRILRHAPHRVLLTLASALELSTGVYSLRDFRIRACVARMPSPPDESFVHVFAMQPRN